MTEPTRLATYSVPEAAARLGVPQRTIRRWLEHYKARLFPRAFRTPGGWWRLDPRDVDALLERRATRCVEDS